MLERKPSCVVASSTDPISTIAELAHPQHPSSQWRQHQHSLPQQQPIASGEEEQQPQPQQTCSEVLLDGLDEELATAAADVCSEPPAPCASTGTVPIGSMLPTWTAESPRLRRRVQAQPVRLATAVVLCYRYAQGQTKPDSGGRWHGRGAQLRYFLPENWSPSYKFTVFEDSSILSFVHTMDETCSSSAHYLARPLHGARVTEAGAVALPEFELVWPVELDVELLKSVEAACDQIVPGAKRKPQEPQVPFLLHLKLQKLDL